MNRRVVIAAALLLAAPGVGVAADQRKKGGGPTFIELTTLTATITRANGSRGVMTVEVGIDVPETALRLRAVESAPLLQSAYAEVLRIYAAGLPPGAPPNADYLELALQRQTDRTLGRPGARLLLGTILIN